MKISKEVKVALLVISGIILFIFGFNYLKGQNLLGSSRTFYAVYDNVEGLAPSTPVTINGLPVGKVIDIGFKEDGSGKLLVKLLVDSDFQFSKNSKAELYATGPLGGKAIAIVPALDGDKAIKNGSYIEASVKTGVVELLNEKLPSLEQNIENTLLSINKTFDNINDVFDEKRKTNLRNSIDGLSDLVLDFKKTSQSLNNLIVNDNSKLNKSLGSFENILANFSKISDSISQTNIAGTINNLESTLNKFNGILAGLEKGEGSMGKLLKDEALYNNLEGASKEMEELLEDIKLHPKRYFRILSKKEIPYTEAESK